MNAIFFSILAIFSLFVFMNLGKIRASKKQMDRDDRIKWGNRRRKSFFKNRSTIIEGKAEEVKDDTEK
jgi:hypothetical protein|tara:strand:- start:1297 stop:1500 length:204 start_codon:yes stop_codon:yes gene_type:complete